MNKKIEKYQDINGNVYQLTTELEKVILSDLIKETESVVELSDENIKLKNKIDKAISMLELSGGREKISKDFVNIGRKRYDEIIKVLKGE